MGTRIKYNDALGQHMTPPGIARLMVDELTGPFSAAVDLSVGDGDLLATVMERWPEMCGFGVDLDPSRCQAARMRVGSESVRVGDGLRARVPSGILKSGRVAFVANPPFLAEEACARKDRWIKRAFPGVSSTLGQRRLEIAFFARYLEEAARCKGQLAIILPSAFASGIGYSSYRESLCEQHRVSKVIEIRHGKFRDTEATTVLLVVDAGCGPTSNVEIGVFDADLGVRSTVRRARIKAGQRLDATFWEGAHLRAGNGPRLRDVGVDIARGTRSRADAERMRHRLLHTTDLARLNGQRIHLGQPCPTKHRDVFAERGDILLPRTGSRVRWVPVEVASGKAPISDHLLRIRAPRGLRSAIKRSFRHPDFPEWLRSVSKGVCATVVTKRELLEMPLFALR